MLNLMPILGARQSELTVLWNSADKGANITLSNGNLDATGATAFNTVRADRGLSAGKRYFELLLTAVSGTNLIVGATSGAASLTTYAGNSANGFGHQVGNGTDYVNGVTNANDPSTTYVTNDVVNIAIDFALGYAWIGKNGTWASGDPAAGTTPFVTGISGTWYPAASLADASNAVRLRTKASQFTISSIPSGFSSWAAA